MGGVPARMVSDKSTRFQVGWTKRRAEGEDWARRGNDVTAQRQNRVPVVSNRGSWEISKMRGEMAGWAAALETAAAACPHKLEQTAVCVCVDGIARPSSQFDAARTARAREWFGQRGERSGG